MRKVTALAAAGLAGLLVTGAPAAAKSWDITLSPNVWLPAVNGQAAIVVGYPEVDVSDGLGDAFSNPNLGVIGIAEARRPEWFLRADITYSIAKSDVVALTPGFTDATLKTNAFNIAGVVGKPLVEANGVRLDAFAGARYWSVKNRINVVDEIGTPTSFSERKKFVDPLVGGATEFQLGTVTKVNVNGWVGGFGIIGADIEYGGSGVLTVQAGKELGISIGYRYSKVDFKSGSGFAYDAAQHGPFIGAVFVY